MVYKKFDIILALYPFTDLSAKKKRPCLVLTELKGENTIVAQITTKSRNIDEYLVRLKKENCIGNILFDSNIYLDMIFTLHDSLIDRKIGEIETNSIKENIENKIKEVFNLK